MNGASPAGRPAVFLDRDGVINENVDGDYVRAWHAFRFLPGALDAIARLTHAGCSIVVVSNQAGVGRGFMAREAVEEIHARMLAAIQGAGGSVAGVYYCAHTIADACVCRKPKPGLITAAAEELGLDLARSAFVGDAVSDVEAARAAGCRAILVRTGRGAQAAATLASRGDDVEVVADLPAAVDLLLGAGA